MIGFVVEKGMFRFRVKHFGRGKEVGSKLVRGSCREAGERLRGLK